MQIRETGDMEEFGDIRQAWDMWIKRTNFPKDMEEAIERVEKSFEALGMAGIRKEENK